MIKKDIKWVLLMFTLLLVGCNAKMNMIVSTPGYLTSFPEVNTLDNNSVNKLNSFSWKLYQNLKEENKNIFISPISIYLALGMTYNGANNNTASQMANVLNVNNLSLQDFNQLNRDLQALIISNNKSSFQLANSLWIRDTYKEYVKEDFINRNKEYYGAMISSLDFNDPNSINTINNWVKDNTKGRIEKAIDDEKINPLTVMYLINTIYFKADWQNPFIKENTVIGEFNTPNGAKDVEMMKKIDLLGYIENDKLQGVLLPYNDNKTAMFVILPKGNLNDLELSDNELSSLLDTMKSNNKQVRLSMPRVKMEYTSKLNDSLISLGMSDAFSSKADFSKMADNAIEDGLHISDVTHKTFLAIDEKGTEAAAMTKVEMNKTSYPLFDYTVDIDHPFLLGIVDKESNTIIFMGAIFDPQAK